MFIRLIISYKYLINNIHNLFPPILLTEYTDTTISVTVQCLLMLLKTLSQICLLIENLWDKMLQFTICLVSFLVFYPPLTTNSPQVIPSIAISSSFLHVHSSLLISVYNPLLSVFLYLSLFLLCWGFSKSTF